MDRHYSVLLREPDLLYFVILRFHPWSTLRRIANTRSHSATAHGLQGRATVPTALGGQVGWGSRSPWVATSGLERPLHCPGGRINVRICCVCRDVTKTGAPSPAPLHSQRDPVKCWGADGISSHRNLRTLRYKWPCLWAHKDTGTVPWEQADLKPSSCPPSS